MPLNVLEELIRGFLLQLTPRFGGLAPGRRLLETRAAAWLVILAVLQGAVQRSGHFLREMVPIRGEVVWFKGWAQLRGPGPSETESLFCLNVGWLPSR